LRHTVKGSSQHPFTVRAERAGDNPFSARIDSREDVQLPLPGSQIRPYDLLHGGLAGRSQFKRVCQPEHAAGDIALFAERDATVEGHLKIEASLVMSGLVGQLAGRVGVKISLVLENELPR
jgi:hypothetical protein